MNTLNNDQDTVLAAIDLGSNSFHLLIAKVNHGEMRPVATRGEKIQLAAGLENGVLNDKSIARGLHCLTQFRQLLDIVQPDILRVVGTNTLRAAKNAAIFVEQGSAILGYPIQTISGREEARLVYLGVAHTLADDEQARLVIDIGGGSTEFIIGEQFETKLLESLHMGCVSYRERFFPGNKISTTRFDKAYRKAYLEVLNIRESFCHKGWDEVVGSSGTFKAIAEVLENHEGAETITRSELEKLRSHVCRIGSINGLREFEVLKPHRRSTFSAGLAICCAIFDALGIEQMRTSPGALREGVVYELMGRLAHEDVRERTITAIMGRYQVDQSNAERVEQFAKHLFEETQGTWGLNESDGELLGWAARLHEIGLSISHSQFHKHGQYLIDNSDLAGFSLAEQRALGLLVRGHRRKFSVALFSELPGTEQQRLQRLCVLLRLAVLFKYVVPIEGTPQLKMIAQGSSCAMAFQQDWLQNHPLTVAELEEEQRYLKAAGFKLSIA